MDFTKMETKEDFMKALKFLGESARAYVKTEQEQKVRNFKTLNRLAKKGQILFTGSSLMEGFAVAEMSLSVGLNGGENLRPVLEGLQG